MEFETMLKTKDVLFREHQKQLKRASKIEGYFVDVLQKDIDERGYLPDDDIQNRMREQMNEASERYYYLLDAPII